MASFVTAVFLLLITPGPGVLSLAGVGAAFGNKAGLRYLIGLFLGTNLVAIAVISGLAAVVFAVPFVRNILLIFSVLYLIFLAGRIALAGSKIAIVAAKSQPGIVSGIILQVFNPKAYAVNTALFTGFAFMPDALLSETIIKLLILNAIWVPIHLFWLMAGTAVQKLDLSPKAQFRINLAMAAALLGVVGLAIWSLI